MHKVNGLIVGVLVVTPNVEANPEEFLEKTSAAENFLRF